MLFDKGCGSLEPLMKQAMVDFLTKKFGPNQRLVAEALAQSLPRPGGEDVRGVRGRAPSSSTRASNTKPGLVGCPTTNDIINEAEFYPGCYARATVRPVLVRHRGEQGRRLRVAEHPKARRWGTVGRAGCRPRKSSSPWRRLAAGDPGTRRRRPRICSDNPYTTT
jgi:hypothetical protein